MSGDTTQYVLDLAATLPVVISDTEAVYLYGLDIIARQQSERLYYVHDGQKGLHWADLSDIDMQLIHSGFREDLGHAYGTLEDWQVSQAPSPIGQQIAPFLSSYRMKLTREQWGLV